jgi:WD40 repeat protein
MRTQLVHLIKSTSTIDYENRIIKIIALKDSKLASIGFGDNTITIWNTKGEVKPIKVLNGHKYNVQTLFLLKDNNLFSSCAESLMIIWNHIDFHMLYKIDASTMVLDILQNTIGQLITTHCDLIRIWDPSDHYNNVLYLEGHEEIIFSASLLKNNDLVSGSMDSTIRIWAFNSNYACISVLKIDHCILTIMPINDNVLAARSHSSITIFGTGIAPYMISDYSITEFSLLQNDSFAIGRKDGSITVYGRVESFEYVDLVTINEHCNKIKFLLRHKHNTLISGSIDKIIIRDINKGLIALIIVDLHSQCLDDIIILDNEIFFSELGSLKRLK